MTARMNQAMPAERAFVVALAALADERNEPTETVFQPAMAGLQEETS